MARYTDPNAIVAKHQALARIVPQKAVEIHTKRTQEISRIVIRELMSGPYKEKDLRNMGHPYARRRMSRQGFQRERLKGGRVLSTKVRGNFAGAGISVPLLPVNKNTGNLVNSAAVLRIRAASGEQTYTLGFRASYAKYVLSKTGTKRMRARGWQAAKARIDKRENRITEEMIRLMILRAAATGRA